MDVNRRAIIEVTKLNEPTQPIGGVLGIPIGGVRTVDVPNRPGFVYVRLRDNTSELIQAFNGSVSPVYGLPVIVEFKGNRYVVIGRDTERYSSWGTSSPYLPSHGSQHSMLANQFGGGDPVWVDGRQMMPGATYPSGTAGGPNVLVSEFLFRNKLGNWLYIGNTGTPNINSLRPSGSNARMVLLCLDYTSGGFVFLTGSTFSATLTGTSQIWPYVPNNNLDQVPLAAIRIVSGTTSIGWDNIYDARQWIDSGFPTGSSGGGGTPGGSNTNVQFNNAGAFGGVNAFTWNNSTGLYIGAPGSPPVSGALLDLVGDGSDAKAQFWSYGEFSASSFVGFRARGIKASPLSLLENDELFRLGGVGFYNSIWSDEQASMQFVADQDWTVTGVGTRAELRVTPRGSLINGLVQQWRGDSIDMYKFLNMNTHLISNVVDPVDPQDVATKNYVDDAIFDISNISFQIDSSGGTSDTYGVLSGAIDGSNTTFTVSLGGFVSGSLQVYLNGQLLTQGSSEDWVETDPNTGEFDFISAPTSGDIIIVFYKFAAVSAINADTLDGFEATHFALASKGVTNGDSHNHVGGDGAPLTYIDVIAAWGNGETVPASTTGYMQFGRTGVSAVIVAQMPWPSAGTLKNFTVRQSGTQPASGSLVVTVQVNGVDTALTITIPAGSSTSTFTDSTHTVAFNAGDTVRFKLVNNATGASTTIAGLSMQLEQNTG